MSVCLVARLYNKKKLVFLILLLILAGAEAGAYRGISYLNQFSRSAISSTAANDTKTLAKFLKTLWLLDENRLEVGEELKLKSHANKFDWFLKLGENKNNLFKRVSRSKLDQPTFKAFISLLDNYKLPTSEVEYVTKQQSQEYWDFIDKLMKTKVMQYTHRFLVLKNLAPESEEQFKGQLYEMWFEFSRPRDFKPGSMGYGQFSPFEHVFVGELHGNKLQGFHNWIQLYRLENNGTVQIKKYQQKACSSEPHFLSINFHVPQLKVDKNGALVLLGTSPEFELAAYTTVFLMNVPGKLKINGCNIYLICIHQYYDKWRPRTCYPKAGFF